MDVDAFLESVSASGVRLTAASIGGLRARAPETMDALFHLPLLALAVMVRAAYAVPDGRPRTQHRDAAGRAFQRVAPFPARPRDIPHAPETMCGRTGFPRGCKAGGRIAGFASRNHADAGG